jgi:hypothetical protein
MIGRTGDVSARLAKVRHQPHPHGISDQSHHDRDRLRFGGARETERPEAGGQESPIAASPIGILLVAFLAALAGGVP